MPVAGSPSACSTEGQPEGTILKSSPRARPEEAEALRLARRIGLPVPDVYNVRDRPGQGGGVEISMELVPGERLEDV